MSKRKGKDKHKIESKPPYFDFHTLRSPHLQVILLATTFASAGAYSPLFYFVSIPILLKLQTVKYIFIKMLFFCGFMAQQCLGQRYGLKTLSTTRKSPFLTSLVSGSIASFGIQTHDLFTRVRGL